MALFRFTMNVQVAGVEEGVFEKVASSILHELLRRQAKGAFDHARVLGRADRCTLKVILEFEAPGHNAAYNYGFDQTADAFQAIGADVSSWFEGSLRAVTYDDGTEWDVLVEELKGASFRPSASHVELVST